MCIVLRRILKVTILYQFRIKSTISSVINIFKENTNQFITDRLRLFRAYRQLQGYRSQSGKTLCILFYTLIVQLVSVGPVVHELQQTVHVFPGHFLHISLFQYTFHYRFLARLTSSFNGRNLFTFPSRLHIVSLRIPLHQIRRSGMPPFFSALVQLPEAVPYSFFIPHQMRIKHAFLCSPGAVITFHISISVTNAKPACLICTPSQLQPTTARIVHSSIRKQIYRIRFIHHFLYVSRYRETSKAST